MPVKRDTAALAFVALLLTGALASGCGPAAGGTMTTDEPASGIPTPSGGTASSGGDLPASGSSGTPLSQIPPPTLPPPDRNQPTPSDYLAGDTIGGRVTKGGPGPCNEIVDDDGKVYSLHNPAGLLLEEGSYVTAKVAPLRARIYCGPGQQLQLVSFSHL